jgi:hypothetical protein
MSEVLDKVPLDCETKAVLAGQSSMLRPLYQLMLAHESGAVASRSAARSEEVASLYRQAPPWARDLSSGASMVYFRLPRGISRFPGFVFKPAGMSSCAKPPMLCLLRCLARTSTMKLFSLATFPRWPSAPSGSRRRDGPVEGKPIRKIRKSSSELKFISS